MIFSRWDHLLRDQQNDADATTDYGTFNYSDEGPGSVPTADRTEVFPEPRYIAPPNLTGCQPLAFNLFGPWQLFQDGTGEETINHIGRHELQNYFDRTFNTDPNLVEFFFDPLARTNQHPIRNLIQLREDATHIGDPLQEGGYVAVDAPEFGSHAAGQIVRFRAPPGLECDRDRTRLADADCDSGLRYVRSATIRATIETPSSSPTGAFSSRTRRRRGSTAISAHRRRPIPPTSSACGS